MNLPEAGIRARGGGTAATRMCARPPCARRRRKAKRKTRHAHARSTTRGGERDRIPERADDRPRRRLARVASEHHVSTGKTRGVCAPHILPPFLSPPAAQLHLLFFFSSIAFFPVARYGNLAMWLSQPRYNGVTGMLCQLGLLDCQPVKT